MTKKHFIALADFIRESNVLYKNGANFSESNIKLLADFCQSQNQNFNRERWLNYIDGKCGKNGGKVKQAV